MAWLTAGYASILVLNEVVKNIEVKEKLRQTMLTKS
jgi:hypothetical protein